MKSFAAQSMRMMMSQKYPAGVFVGASEASLHSQVQRMAIMPARA